MRDGWAAACPERINTTVQARLPRVMPRTRMSDRALGPTERNPTTRAWRRSHLKSYRSGSLEKASSCSDPADSIPRHVSAVPTSTVFGLALPTLVHATGYVILRAMSGNGVFEEETLLCMAVPVYLPPN